jgi:signal transduction histidine kinase
MQAKVFDMFMRGSSQSTGSGLGLYICREMTEKLGGRIKVISEIDKGSVFTATIPNLIPHKKAKHESSFIH